RERGQRQGIAVTTRIAGRGCRDLIGSEWVNGERGCCAGGSVIGEQIRNRRGSVQIDSVIERRIDLIGQRLCQGVEASDIGRQYIIVVVQFGAELAACDLAGDISPC